MEYKALLRKKRRKILETAARYGASNVRVFGSVARGEEDEASDIDFLVDLASDRSLFDLGGLLYELLQVWVVHHLQIIGEAAFRLSEEIREKHSEVAWGGMIGMRHVVV
jgi:predicted nucleotidyltransferase